MVYVTDVSFEGQTVLDAQHNALLSFAFGLQKVVGSACERQVWAVLGGYGFNLREHEVGILARRDALLEGYVVPVLHHFHALAELFALAWLGQVAHHEHRILTAFGHLVQVYEDAWVALLEVYALMEEHRCVDVGVDSEHLRVQKLGA